MKAIEAIAMMETAPQSDTEPARVNKSLTQAQAVGLVRSWIKEYPPEYVLTPLMEKRVYQVCRNQKRPVISETAP